VSNEEFTARLHAATVPDDLNDPPRFSQVIETTKDAFVLELRRFFDINQTAARLSELPTIEKYAIGFAPSQDPYETTVAILQEFPDVLEQLPHISITAGGGRNKRLTFGRPLIAQTQQPPRVVGTAGETFALADNDQLVFRTKPNGVDWVTSTIVFRSARFPTANPITAALADDVARVINEQALYARASVVDIGGGTQAIQLATGGLQGRCMPNAIEILTGTSANVLTELGLTVGQADDSTNTARPPMNRYHNGAEVTVNIDVIAVDPNVRRELADLVFSWATFWLERKHFELLGRSVFDETITEEHYQIIIHQEVSFGGEQDVARPNDMKDKIHFQRVTVPVSTFMYLDRPVVIPSGAAQGDNWQTDADDVTPDADLITPS